MLEKTPKNTRIRPTTAPDAQTCCGAKPLASRVAKAPTVYAGANCRPISPKQYVKTKDALQMPPTGASRPRPATNCTTPGISK